MSATTMTIATNMIRRTIELSSITPRARKYPSIVITPTPGQYSFSPMPPRRFPPPWSAEMQPNYYVVRDANGQQLAYVHYSNDPDRRTAAKLLTKDEAFLDHRGAHTRRLKLTKHIQDQKF